MSNFEFNEQQKEAISLAVQWYKDFRDGRPVRQFFALGGYAGTGKSQNVNCLVETPTGRRKIGELKVGDFVIGSNGKKTEVIGVYPQGIMPSYRITFRDGFSTLANAEHLWATISKKKHQKVIVRTTKSMLDAGLENAGGMKFKIPLCAPVQYENEYQPKIPSYVVGVLIGDGSLSCATPLITIGNEDFLIFEKVKSLLPHMKFTSSQRQGCVRTTIHNEGKGNMVMDYMKELHLNVTSHQKFIPEPFFFCSVEERKEMLRGLMDTDGSCKGNRTSFSTMSPQLADDVCRLVQSLGGVAVKHEFDREEKGIEFSVNVKTNFCPFSLERKAKSWSPSKKNPPSRYIRSIELEGECEQVCIKVAAEDELYLTDHFIVTHNTSVARHISNLCCSPARVKYIAPTGKAASRLRDKGCAGAGTIHKFLYNYLGSSSKEDPEFEVKATLDEQPLLIVCDEASMVGLRMGRDIVSKGIPVLFLGDLGQVEPVNAEPFLSPEDFDYNLEKIERNGGNIVRASFYVRTGGRLPAREYDDVKVFDRRYTMSDVERHLSEDSVLLCSYNSTRQLLNAKARIALKHNESKMPCIGEKVVCTFNQHSYGIANGEQFILQDIRNLHDHEFGDTDDEFMMMATLKSITNDEVKIAKFYTGCFLGADEQECMSSMKRPGGFDFGYALTIHKAQGSEWKNVMVIEEFMRGAAYHKMMYTAVTRAIEHLTVFRSK